MINVRQMTDLEEQILFILSISESELSALAIMDKVCEQLKKSVSLGEIHKTLWQLQNIGFITSNLSVKKMYCITGDGKTALQLDWMHHAKLVNES